MEAVRSSKTKGAVYRSTRRYVRAELDIQVEGFLFCVRGELYGLFFLSGTGFHASVCFEAVCAFGSQKCQVSS